MSQRLNEMSDKLVRAKKTLSKSGIYDELDLGGIIDPIVEQMEDAAKKLKEKEVVWSKSDEAWESLTFKPPKFPEEIYSVLLALDEKYGNKKFSLNGLKQIIEKKYSFRSRHVRFSAYFDMGYLERSQVAGKFNVEYVYRVKKDALSAVQGHLKLTK